ncbi:hypothetical protein [Thiothrix nivea]|uniref:Lipoprotein n=1 Tax=Thiothrix nivea (strain ATCC 35100 / DSM 5205 / JP2) TaxID=870187 RepID=A0A656HA54_THINJ|nr:hypothetical protein [Thiothrix nivea]EIJ33578.1 hypothetical protein Thini_0953 [Thiothrix nivea DSM 5205]
MQVLRKYIPVAGVLMMAGWLAGCAGDPVKETVADANAKPINYGCSGTSINDCMTFHTPGSGGKPSH